MNQQEKKKVKAWLYQISRKELSIANIRTALDDLKFKLANQPSRLISGVGNYDILSGGAGEGDSKQDRYAAWVEQTRDRHEFLTERLDILLRDVQRYYNTLDSLRQEYGNRPAEIIDFKYRRHIRPDRDIWKVFTFCSRETFYREHRWALQFFHDVNQDKFMRPCSCYKCFL